MKWFKGSEELKPSPKYNMEVTPRTAVLTVKGAEKEDESAYRAELENVLGKDKADMKAEVVEKEGRTILSLLYRITWKTETKMYITVFTHASLKSLYSEVCVVVLTLLSAEVKVVLFI